MHQPRLTHATKAVILFFTANLKKLLASAKLFKGDIDVFQ